MSELVLALLTWIVAETGLLMPPPPPVVLLPKEEISQIAYGRGWQPSDDVPGVYDRDAETVYLRNDDWNRTDLRSRARLLHELVHHVQTFNRIPYPCPASREPQAYHLAIKWLQQQGAADPYQVLDIDEFSIFVRSLCPEG